MSGIRSGEDRSSRVATRLRRKIRESIPTAEDNKNHHVPASDCQSRACRDTWPIRPPAVLFLVRFQLFSPRLGLGCTAAPRTANNTQISVSVCKNNTARGWIGAIHIHRAAYVATRETRRERERKWPPGLVRRVSLTRCNGGCFGFRGKHRCCTRVEGVGRGSSINVNADRFETGERPFPRLTRGIDHHRSLPGIFLISAPFDYSPTIPALFFAIAAALICVAFPRHENITFPRVRTDFACWRRWWRLSKEWRGAVRTQFRSTRVLEIVTR